MHIILKSDSTPYFKLTTMMYTCIGHSLQYYEGDVISNDEKVSLFFHLKKQADFSPGFSILYEKIFSPGFPFSVQLHIKRAS